MNSRHTITATAPAAWTAEAELVDGELEVGKLTPGAGPDGPEYYYCTCGAEFENEAQATDHLRSVDTGTEQTDGPE